MLAQQKQYMGGHMDQNEAQSHRRSPTCSLYTNTAENSLKYLNASQLKIVEQKPHQPVPSEEHVRVNSK